MRTASLALCATILFTPAAIAEKPNAQADAIKRLLESQFEAGNRWAILIGINGYTKLDPLGDCVADAKLLAACLSKVCGYDTSRVVLLTDDQKDPDFRPTKANLQKQVVEVLKKVGPKDTILISFAGHGYEKGGQSLLCPFDFDPAHGNLTGWRVDELRALMHDCKAAQKILVLDCCHSGIGQKNAPVGPSSAEVAKGFELAQGLITFCSCKHDESSMGHDGHGVFTRSFVKGLLGDADFDNNGIVDNEELYRFALVDVIAYVKRADPRHKQTPIRIIGGDVVGLFALSRPRGPIPDELKMKKVAPEGLKPGTVVVNSIGMKLVYLGPGVAPIGSPKKEAYRKDDEEQGAVGIGKQIFMGVYEVTQAEYKKIMGKNPSYFSTEGEGGDEVKGLDTSRFPVEQVSWDDAVEFCKRLSELPAEKKARVIYRLPTEAEWEYGCRAGTGTVFHYGERLSPKDANVNGDRPYLDSPPGKTLSRPTTVGSYQPNAFGVYDMHGNVAEWCHDFYQRRRSMNWGWAMFEKNHQFIGELAAMVAQSGKGLEMDPTGPNDGTTHTLRGGAFVGDVATCRAAARREMPPDRRYKAYGFRVVAEPAAPPKNPE